MPFIYYDRTGPLLPSQTWMLAGKSCNSGKHFLTLKLCPDYIPFSRNSDKGGLEICFKFCQICAPVEETERKRREERKAVEKGTKRERVSSSGVFATAAVKVASRTDRD